MIDFRASLLKAAKQYEKATGNSRATFASQAVKDARFFDRIENGSTCTFKTYEKIMAWFEENMPLPSSAREHKINSNLPRISE